MSAHNFWDNFTHGFVHGMFGNSPFFGCSWGNFGFNSCFNSYFSPYNNLYFVPNVFSSMNFSSLMPEMSPPIFDNVSIDMNKLFPTDNWQVPATNNFNFNFGTGMFDTFENTSVKPKVTQNSEIKKSNVTYKPAKMTGKSVNDKYFDKMLNHILFSESGYANNPKDRGGETNRGVTKETYNNYRRQKGLPIQSVRYITDAEVKDIYYNIFKECGADKISNPQIAFMVFDVSVNSGAGKGKKMLRECGDDLKKMERWRRNYYANIVKRDPEQKVHIDGWNNRVTNAMQFATANLPSNSSA